MKGNYKGGFKFYLSKNKEAIWHCPGQVMSSWQIAERKQNVLYHISAEKPLREKERQVSGSPRFVGDFCKRGCWSNGADQRDCGLHGWGTSGGKQRKRFSLVRFVCTHGQYGGIRKKETEWKYITHGVDTADCRSARLVMALDKTLGQCIKRLVMTQRYGNSGETQWFRGDSIWFIERVHLVQLIALVDGLTAEAGSVTTGLGLIVIKGPWHPYHKRGSCPVEAGVLRSSTLAWAAWVESSTEILCSFATITRDLYGAQITAVSCDKKPILMRERKI